MIQVESWMFFVYAVALVYFSWFFYNSAKRKYGSGSGKEYLQSLLNSIEDSEKWKMYSINMRTKLLMDLYKNKGIEKSEIEIATEALLHTEKDFKTFSMATDDIFKEALEELFKEKGEQID